MSRFFQRFVFVLSVAIFASLSVGFALGAFGVFGVRAGGEQDGAYRQMRVYAEVLSKIQSDYVTQPNLAEVTTGALHGLLESLDPDSSYLTPAEYNVYKAGSPAGSAEVGLTVSKRYGYAVVVTVLPGSPADKAQIADGDIIESIGGQSTREMAPAVIRLLLLGKPGTTVTLSVIRPRKAAPDQLVLTRTVETAPPLAVQQYENGTILYLKPGALTRLRVDEIASRIKTAGKGTKILLDLRESAGGDEAQGLRLANFFLQQGTLATLEGQKYPRQTFTADPAQFLTAAPLAVLVNGSTYGPAELTAAALEGAKRADVIGERTFGEGSVQKTFELPGGAAVLLTVAKYEGPNGKKIEEEAVAPTVLVAPPLDDEGEALPQEKTDGPLQKALQLLKAKNS
ncbi:MAG: S41 family peptidase [Terracidiphilus sp.]